MEWIEVVMEEYKTLREESLTAMQLQQAVLRYGLALVGLLVATALHIWADALLSSVLLLLFIPLISYLILVIWMGEIARMMRVGFHIKKVEEKVNKQFTDLEPPLTWEIWLREMAVNSTPQLNWNYYAILGMLFIIAIAAVVLGNVKLWPIYGIQGLLVINGAEVLVFAAVFLHLLATGQRFR